jgi:prepilin-type N-terminal cleavage/methylation domain-containing protein
MKEKGFTLIEMLVVVAVIGILSSILLTALGPARYRAKDSRIVQEVNQVRSIAETLYDGTYAALETPPVIDKPELRTLAEDIALQGGELRIVKSSSLTAFAAYSKLNTKVGVEPDVKVNYYCVDSGGRAVFTTTEPDPNSGKCPS